MRYEKMTRIILNCPVKKFWNINLIIDRVFERTNDRPGQPEEPGKPEIKLKQPCFLKLYIKSGSN